MSFYTESLAGVIAISYALSHAKWDMNVGYVAIL